MLHNPYSQKEAVDLDEEMAGAVHRHGRVNTSCDNYQSATGTLLWGYFITQV